MTTDNRKLAEVFRIEYEATGRNLEAAVAAVVTTVKAQLELPLPPTGPVELRVVVVHQHVRAPDPRPETLHAKVRRLAAAEFGVELRHFKMPTHGPRKRGRHWRPFSDVRWAAIGVFRDMGMSLAACAHAAGLSDHSSVIYALRAIKERPYLQAAIARVKAAVEGGEPETAGEPTTSTTEVEAA